MRPFRTRSVGIKLSEAEYATLVTACPEPNLSKWSRRTLLAAAQSEPVDRLILAELLAMRAIVLTLHFSIVSGEPMTAERLRALVDRADEEKVLRAQERLAGESNPKSEPRRR